MKFIKTRKVKSPTRGTSESAGLDFYVPDDFNDGKIYSLYSGESIKIPSGIKMVLPKGKVGIFMNKSSHGSDGIIVGACVVDSDYRGEVHLNVHHLRSTNENLSFFTIKPGMKLVQMVIQDVDLTNPEQITEEQFEAVSQTERGEGGFGSTGA